MCVARCKSASISSSFVCALISPLFWDLSKSRLAFKRTSWSIYRKQSKSKQRKLSSNPWACTFNKRVGDFLNKVKKKQAQNKKIRATFLGKDCQNQIIGIFGRKILEEVAAEVKEAGMFSIISDEGSANNKQFLTVGVR